MLRCCNSAQTQMYMYCMHESHPLGLVLAGSQSEAGCAHTCNPSLSSLESQTGPNKHDIKRFGSGQQNYYFFTVRTGNRGGNFNSNSNSNLNSNSKFIHPPQFVVFISCALRARRGSKIELDPDYTLVR